jgi:hypothetical protein
VSVAPISTRPLVHARRMCVAAGDNLSLALAFEGMSDRRFVDALDGAEAALLKALDLIRAARGPVQPVPPAVAHRADAHFALACAITGAAPLEEVA